MYADTNLTFIHFHHEPSLYYCNRPYNEKKQFVLFTAQDGTTSLAVSTKSTFHPFIQYDLSQTTKRSKTE